MSVIYNALKKFKHHPQKRMTKKEDAQKKRDPVSLQKFLFSPAALTGCIFFFFFLGIGFLFSILYQKQGVLAKTDEPVIMVRKIENPKAQNVQNRSIGGPMAFKTSQQNPAGNIPAPSGSLDDSITQRLSSGPSQEEDLNRARYLAPRPRNDPFQQKHLQNLAGEVSHISQDILRGDQDRAKTLSKKPDQSGRDLAPKDDESLSQSSRHLVTSSSAVAAEEFGPSAPDTAEIESASSRAHGHPAAREKVHPVRVRSSAEIIRLVAKIKKSIRHGTAVHTENLLDQLAVLKGTDDRYVLKLRAYWSLQNNDYESAASYLTKVLEKNSEDLEAGINMAIIDINSSRPQLARIRLQELEKIYPDNLSIADLMQKLQ
jgi:hypothetical protein